MKKLRGGNLLIYFILFLYIFLYSYFVQGDVKKFSHFMIIFMPISILLVMILGLQDNVGVDYHSYLDLASGFKDLRWIESKSEYLFIAIINIVILSKNPQLLFFLIAIIQVVFIMLIAYEIKKLNFKVHHFFFLYFTLSLAFFNQFNGIRQYVAVYIVVYAFLKLMYNKKITFIGLIIFASLFHSSAIYFLVFVFFRKILTVRVSVKKIILILCVLLILSSLDMSKYIEMIISYTSYNSYIGSSYFGKMSIQGIITKIPKLVIVLFSSLIIDKNNLTSKEINLINLSYIGCIIQILSFSSTVIWRFYQYVDLFIIYPVLIMFNDNSKRYISIINAIILMIMLIIKIIIMPKGEYLYNSILF